MIVVFFPNKLTISNNLGFFHREEFQMDEHFWPIEAHYDINRGFHDDAMVQAWLRQYLVNFRARLVDTTIGDHRGSIDVRDFVFQPMRVEKSCQYKQATLLFHSFWFFVQ